MQQPPEALQSHPEHHTTRGTPHMTALGVAGCLQVVADALHEFGQSTHPGTHLALGSWSWLKVRRNPS